MGGKKSVTIIAGISLIVLITLGMTLFKSCARTNNKNNSSDKEPAQTSEAEVIEKKDTEENQEKTDQQKDDAKKDPEKDSEKTEVKDSEKGSEKEEVKDSEESSYTVKFLNIDGTVLQSKTYKADKMPAYNGSTPSYADGIYTYIFTGWDKEITKVNADQTYTATYYKTYIKRDPTVTSPAAKTLTYTGKPQELITAGSTNGGTLQYKLKDGEYSAAVPTATDAGTYTVYYKVTGNSQYNDIKEQSVVVTIHKANASISVDQTSISKKYGESLTLPVASSNFGTVKCDKTSEDLKDAGTYTITYTVEGTENYFADTKTVDVTIGKRQLTLKSASVSKTYDGTPLTSDSVTVSGDGFAADEGASYSVTGSQTTVGSSKNSFTYSLNSNTKASNYTITCTEGDLTISKVTSPITITAGSNSKTYDGTALTYPEYTYTTGVLASGDTLSATVAGTITNAGTTANKVTSYKVTNANGDDITDYYTFAPSVDGTLTVNKRNVTITTYGETKEYDGVSSVSNMYKQNTITGDGWATNQFPVTSQPGYTLFTPGKITNSYTIRKIVDRDDFRANRENAADLSSNYNITINEGILEMTKRKITVTVDSDSKAYDGEPLSASTYTITSGSLVAGHELKVSFQGSQTSIGATAAAIDYYKIVDTASADVTSYYDVTTETGTLSVTKIPLTITAGSATKAYDGEALTSDSYSITSGSLLNGHTVSVSTQGSQTDPGSSENIISSCIIEDDNSTDVTAYYDITTVSGLLNVTEQAELCADHSVHYKVTFADNMVLYDIYNWDNEQGKFVKISNDSVSCFVFDNAEEGKWYVYSADNYILCDNVHESMTHV